MEMFRRSGRTAFQAALALGGLRAAIGLGNIARGKHLPRQIKTPQPLVVDVPYRAEEEEDPRRRKRAFVNDALKWTMGHGKVLAEQAKDIPAYPTVVAGGGLLGAYGGWKLVDALLRKHKRLAMDDELESAREDYRKATLGKTTELDASKFANAIRGEGALGKSAEAARTIYEDPEVIKQAFLEETGTEAAKAYGIVAAALGLGTGALAHNYIRGQSFDAEKAENLRKQYERSASSAPPIMARFVPVDANGRPIKRRKMAPPAPPLPDSLGAKVAEFVQKIIKPAL